MRVAGSFSHDEKASCLIMNNNPAVAYRPDIDGMRALAVLAVVFYHFGIGGLSGGFVGVDIFYVISGFLITGIIQREIEQGRFTFAGFYERRIRRIFPALFVVLAITLVAGFFILLPTDLILLGKSTIATLLFSSNIFFWRTSGYFDHNSELNPLLHTWSLAVEEQFYIGLPILLILVYRYVRGWLKPVLIVSAILSFAASLWMQGFRPAAAFYLSPFRAWELLLGSYLAVGSLPLITKSWLRELLAWLGLALLMASILLIKAGPEFPGWQALGPVLGTGLLIYAGGSGQTKVSSFLSIKPLVFIGLISYSLYLWHWPIVVYAKYLNGLEPIGAWAWVGVALSIMLATATYYWVETPFRLNKKIFSRPRLFAGAVTATILLSAVGIFSWQSNGFPVRMNKNTVKLDKLRHEPFAFINCDSNPSRALGSEKCVIGKRQEIPVILLWGDSHALAIAPSFNIALERNSLTGLVITNAGCPPLVSINVSDNPKCQKFNDEVINYIKTNSNIKYIVLHAFWEEWSNYPRMKTIRTRKSVKFGNSFEYALIETIELLSKLEKNIIIIGPVTGQKLTPLQIIMNHNSIPTINGNVNSSEFQIKIKNYKNTLDKLNAQHVKIIDLTTVLCGKNKLCEIEDKNNELIYKDLDHLSISGNEYLEKYMTSEIIKVISIPLKPKTVLL